MSTLYVVILLNVEYVFKIYIDQTLTSVFNIWGVYHDCIFVYLRPYPSIRRGLREGRYYRDGFWFAHCIEGRRVNVFRSKAQGLKHNDSSFVPQQECIATIAAKSRYQMPICRH